MTIKNGNLLVQVTVKDIQNGVPSDSSCCGIALAIKRTLDVDNVQVGLDEIADLPEIRVEDAPLNIPTRYHEPISKFIKSFDNMDDINVPSPQPFEFEIGEDKQWVNNQHTLP